jgi:hypothetical protein
MKHNPSHFPGRHGWVVIGSMIFAMLAAGCGEGTPATSTPAARPPLANPSPTVSKTRHPGVDTTSRREHQKQTGKAGQ